MHPHLASWIVMLGLAIATTGCVSNGSSSETMESHAADHYRLKRQPAVIGMEGGVMQAASSEYSPTEAVQITITDLLSVLGNDAMTQPGWYETRRQQIEQIIRRHVNCERMAQRSLGAPWIRLNDTERQEFVHLFIELIRDRVANQIDQYYDEQIFYLSEQREGNFAEVKTNLIGQKVDTSLDFRVENHSGNWLVYDVVIDRASIVGNYRTQFSRLIRDTSYAGLVETIKQRAHTVKSFEKTAPALTLFPAPPFDPLGK